MHKKTHHSVLFLLYITISCFSSLTVAQSPQPLSAIPKRAFNHDGKFVTKYSEKENSTHVFLEPVFIERSESEKTSLRLAANYQYEGTAPTKPKHITLAFYTLYPECKIPFRPNMKVIIESEAMEFKFSFKGWWERKPDEEGVAFSFSEMEGDRCNEVVSMFISQKNFLKLVKANNVEIQIDRFRFKLNESNLEALRDLASQMVL